MTLLIACLLIYKFDMDARLYGLAALLYLLEAQLTGKLQAFRRWFKTDSDL